MVHIAVISLRLLPLPPYVLPPGARARSPARAMTIPPGAIEKERETTSNLILRIEALFLRDDNPRPPKLWVRRDKEALRQVARVYRWV